MKNKRLILRLMRAIAILLLLISARITNAQHVPSNHNSHPASNYHGAVLYRVQHRSVYYPPFQSDMPFDVMEGYFYFDSIVRSLNAYNGQADSVIASMYDSDTLRQGLKYLYEMTDWDPITFFQYWDYMPNGGAYAYRSARAVFDDLMSRVESGIPDSGKEFSYFMQADAILHVTVLDTIYVPDGRDTAVRVHCTIDDIIKGQRLLPCTYNITSIGGKPGKGASPQTMPGDCLDFEYWLNSEIQIKEPGSWPMKNCSPHWILPGNDYIVFLQYTGVGGDSLGHYMAFDPIPIKNVSSPYDYTSFSTMMNVYPVRSGVVYDPNNDFGFGTGLSVVDFKAALRSKIQSILSGM